MTLSRQLLERLQIGVEYNLAVSEVSPLFSLFLCTETATRPALFLGTSSDRIGSPAGKQSYFVTLTKSLPSVPISVYTTANYSEWDQGINFPFGASIELNRGFSVRAMYDGERSHLLFNCFQAQYGASLMYIWFERFGMTMSMLF